MLPALDTASHANKGGERERQKDKEWWGTFIFRFTNTPTQYTGPSFPLLCCPIQICCNEYFAEDVNRFLDGGCRSSSVFGLPFSLAVFSLAPFPNPPALIALPFSTASSSSLCACKAQFVASLLRSSARLIRKLFEGLRALLLFV